VPHVPGRHDCGTGRWGGTEPLRHVPLPLARRAATGAVSSQSDRRFDDDTASTLAVRHRPSPPPRPPLGAARRRRSVPSRRHCLSRSSAGSPSSIGAGKFGCRRAGRSVCAVVAAAFDKRRTRQSPLHERAIPFSFSLSTVEHDAPSAAVRTCFCQSYAQRPGRDARSRREAAYRSQRLPACQGVPCNLSRESAFI
jgi:hypothetical protein